MMLSTYCSWCCRAWLITFVVEVTHVAGTLYNQQIVIGHQQQEQNWGTEALRSALVKAGYTNVQKLPVCGFWSSKPKSCSDIGGCSYTCVGRADCEKEQKCLITNFENMTASMKPGSLFIFKPHYPYTASGANHANWSTSGIKHADPRNNVTQRYITELINKGVKVILLEADFEHIPMNGSFFAMPDYEGGSYRMAKQACQLMNLNDEVLIFNRLNSHQSDKYFSWPRYKGFRDGLRDHCPNGVYTNRIELGSYSVSDAKAMTDPYFRGRDKIKLVFAQSEAGIKGVIEAATIARPTGIEGLLFASGSGALFRGPANKLWSDGVLNTYVATQTEDADFGLIPGVVNLIPVIINPPLDKFNNPVKIPRLQIFGTFVRSSSPVIGLTGSLTRSGRLLSSPVRKGNVNLNSTINLQLLRLDTRASTFTLRGVINAKWNDPRLRWDRRWGIDNLTMIQEMNLGRVVPPSPIMWYPNIVPTLFREYEKISTKVEATADGNVTMALLFEVTAGCPFDFANFPGDEQRCVLRMRSEQPNVIFFNGGVLANIQVQGYTSVKYESMGGEEFSLRFVVRRLISMHVITLFLPSIVLALISTMLFLSVGTAGPRVMSSVLAIMTLYNLSSRVFAQLPPSAVPSWLLMWFTCHLVFQTVLFSCYATNWDSLLMTKILRLQLARRYQSRARQEVVQKKRQEENDWLVVDHPCPDVVAEDCRSNKVIDLDEVSERGSSVTQEQRAMPKQAEVQPKDSMEKRTEVELERLVKERMPSEADIDKMSCMVFGSIYVIMAAALLAQQW